MTTPDPLATLLAALDEDERIARAAAKEKGPHWSVTHIPYEGVTIWAKEDGLPGYVDDETGHIEAFDPARVLSGELPLKRLILRDHQPQEMDHGTYCVECSTSLSLNINEVPWPCEYIRALAGIYTEPTGERSES